MVCDTGKRMLECEIHVYDGLEHTAYEEVKDFNQRVYDFLIE